MRLRLGSMREKIAAGGRPDSYELLAQRAGERDEEDLRTGLFTNRSGGPLPPALLFPNEIEPPFSGHEGKTHGSLCSKGG